MFDRTRREFLVTTSGAFAALLASGCLAPRRVVANSPLISPYGPLRSDAGGMLELPEGFAYRVISRLGDRMSDGMAVPDRADGMGCFDLGHGKIALVRNHELQPMHDAGGTFLSGYDRNTHGNVLPGGTTTLVLDSQTLVVERQYRSLVGTIRNCSGGVTPWGSWLTCEEDVTNASNDVVHDHGWVFEVPASADGLVDPVPLKALGRFNHEAACVDPASGIVYLTEDRDNSLLYRFIPAVNGRLARGGRLQALVAEGVADTRNQDGIGMPQRSWADVRWIDLDDVESPKDDLRVRGAELGATLFARGEGIHMGDGELYFCCTSGGAAGLGQIFRLVPKTDARDELQLFFESDDPNQFNYGDNLTVSPNGHLIVCEDQYTEVVDNHLRGITPDGQAYPLAKLCRQAELAGACWSPDGRTLFVNAYSPSATLAITGPWTS